MRNELENLKKRLLKDNIELNQKFYILCEKYISYLLKYNKVHNITGAKDEINVIENIYDSIFPLPYLDLPKTVLDIGTGAGFPALILAFALPKSQIYLVEPNLKRVAFLTLIKTSLQVKNITILAKRVEKIDDLEVELITSRAVTSLELLFKISRKIISKKTKFLFYKGSSLKEEMKKDSHFEYKIIKREFRNYLFIRQKNV